MCFQIWHEGLGEFSKVYQVSAKKIERSYLSWHWTVIQNLNKPCNLRVSKMAFEELGGLSLEHSKARKTVHWWALFVQKYNVSVRKFQRNYVSWHWKLMLILKKNWHVASKITRNLVNFVQAVESLKICTLIRSFCPKHIKFRWKNTEELCFLALKSDAKFKEKLTLGSKNDMTNLVNFHLTTQWAIFVRNFTSIGYFCPNYMRFELKK